MSDGKKIVIYDLISSSAEEDEDLDSPVCSVPIVSLNQVIVLESRSPTTKAKEELPKPPPGLHTETFEKPVTKLIFEHDLGFLSAELEQSSDDSQEFQDSVDVEPKAKSETFPTNGHLAGIARRKILPDSNKMLIAPDNQGEHALPFAPEPPLFSRSPSLAKKRALSPTTITSFFCKSKPKAIISQIEQAVRGKSKMSAQDHPDGLSGEEMGFNLFIGPKRRKERSIPDNPVLPALGPTFKADIPINGAPEEKATVNEKVSTSVPVEMAEIATTPIDIIRLRSKFHIPVISTPSAKKHQQTKLEEDDDIDPALKEALMSAASKDSTENLGIDAAEPIVIKIHERLSMASVKDSGKRPPLGLKITRNNTFGQIKKVYCATKKIAFQPSFVLTFKDAPLFDSVTVGASGIPVIGNQLELTIYDRYVLEQIKQDIRKQRDTAFELLKEDLSPTQAFEPLDLDMLMEEDETSRSMFIKIKVCQEEPEAFPVKPDTVLSDLLKAYEHQHLGVDLSNARLVFDGSVLPLSQTISGAELESDDLVELRL